MVEDKFDKVKFVEAASIFRVRLKQEEMLAELTMKAMSCLSDAAVSLVATTKDNTQADGGPLLTAQISDTSVQIEGGGRNILLTPAHGSGLDLRLPRPRSQACGQILVFGHLTGHEETSLLSSFRIYSDGLCTDGESTWNLEEGNNRFLNYLGHLVQTAIFDCELSWPELNNLPPYLQKLTVADLAAHQESLRKPCVGFECALKKH